MSALNPQVPISQTELRRLLELPEDGDDREVATAFALQAGLKPPTGESSVQYLTMVIKCIDEVLFTPPEHLWESAEAAHSITGRAFHQMPSNEMREWTIDLGGGNDLDGVLMTHLVMKVIPKLAHAGLIEVVDFD